MICTFEQFTETQHARQAGGKGSVLARLYQAGYPVPDGFIILSSAFDEKGLLDGAADAVRHHYKQLCGSGDTTTNAISVAVRSSALAEDSADHSYAGEFDSVLNVTDSDALFAAVKIVFESCSNERVKAYADAAQQSDQQTVAVVVQKMLDPAYAGVLFTVDPVSGDTRLMQGNLTQGLGEKLVSGEVSGEVFHFKQDGTYTGPDFFHPYQQELFKTAQDIVALFGSPQDIEWAVEQDKVHILQSRPITHLTHTPEIWNDSLKSDYLWCNTNLGELFGNVITPFTWSVFHEVVGRNVGPVGNHFMVGLIAGRSYFNISLIYSILTKMGKKRKDVLSSFDLFLGNIPDHVNIPLVELSWGQALGFMLRQTSGAIKYSMKLKKFLAWSENECPQWCDQQLHTIAQCKNNDELLKDFDTIEPVIFETFAMVAFIGNQFVQQQYKLKSALTGLLSTEELEVILSGLDGNGQLKSLGPLLGVSALADGKITEADFIKNYGHRGPDEAEFAAPRTAEDPDWISKLLRQWGDADPEVMLQKQQQKRDTIWASLEQNHPKQAPKLHKLLTNAIKLAHNRELAKSENFRQANVIRQFVIRVAQLNHQQPDDLFYLHKDELLAFIKGNQDVLLNIKPRQETYAAYSSIPPVPNLISGAIEPFQWAKLSDRRTDYFDANYVPSVDGNNDSLLRGFPGSAGTVEGTVRVLLSHEEIDEFMSNEILVTSFTNVGWTPVFPRAAAIITDIGAPLSHAAIVARELGIPAVVGTGFATMKLETGCRVRVNGSQGTVELL